MNGGWTWVIIYKWRICVVHRVYWKKVDHFIVGQYKMTSLLQQRVLYFPFLRLKAQLMIIYCKSTRALAKLFVISGVHSPNQAWNLENRVRTILLLLYIVYSHYYKVMPQCYGWPSGGFQLSSWWQKQPQFHNGFIDQPWSTKKTGHQFLNFFSTSFSHWLIPSLLQDIVGGKKLKCWMVTMFFVNKNTVWEFGGLYSESERMPVLLARIGNQPMETTI